MEVATGLSRDERKGIDLDLHIILIARPRYQEKQEPGPVPGFLCLSSAYGSGVEYLTIDAKRNPG